METASRVTTRVVAVSAARWTATFHASSYGTLLGAQYAETYPRRVRAMVLDSVMDHAFCEFSLSTPVWFRDLGGDLAGNGTATA
ncbi:hypothetical protein GCM10020295_00590 [Streptomyces cinereospinus]